MKNGFTLVELSIVLVIIGLLIGGILVGQSLISSAKINKQIQQIEQIHIAVSQFKSKFNSLPGDSNKIGATGYNVDNQPERVCAGNGNGRIENGIVAPLSGSPEWYTSNGNMCEYERDEHMRVFEQLGVTGMYKWSAYNDADTSSHRPGVAYPKMILDSYDPKSLGIPGGVVVGWEGGLSYVAEGHKIRLGACNGGSGGPIAGLPASSGTHTSFYCGPSLTDMIAIDKKMDDGRPMSGEVVATSNYYIYRINGGLLVDQTGCCINSYNTYKTEPTGTSVGNGSYIGLEVNMGF